jgi:hypothetical protein
MSELTRREVLTRLAAGFAATAAVDYALGEQVHALVRQTTAGGTYSPQALTPAQFRTLERLVDLIVPVDRGNPGAVAAGVPAWIDALLAVSHELKAKYDDGLKWLDTTMLARSGAPFAEAPVAGQTALLDIIAFKKNASPEFDPGIAFFALARRMTVDGFYTSEVGIRDIIPNGRPPLAEFVVPQASIDYVISRSPFK